MCEDLLARILERGDYIAIECGRLILRSRSGDPIPEAWFNQHKEAIVKEAIALLSINAYRYVDYSTGHYGDLKYSGITIQFTHINADIDPYAPFNADLKRARTTAHGKKGAPLPKGHFRVGKKSGFYKFWQRTSLEDPRRLSEFHEHMYKLKKLFFTLRISKNDRIEKDSIEPLNISYELLKNHIADLGNSSAKARQPFGNSSAKGLGKESVQSQKTQGLEPTSTTGKNNYGNKVIREHGYKGDSHIIPIQGKTPQEQTNEEWLYDFENG